MMGLLEGQKSFIIGLVGLVTQTQYRHVTDRQTHCHSKDHAMLCVVRVKIIK